MPIYEYFCSQCKLKFELMRPVSYAGENASCPQCHSESRRVFSPFVAFSRFAAVEEGTEPIAGTTSPYVSHITDSCATG